MLKYINDKYELTPESRCETYTMLICLYLAQLICERIVRRADRDGIRDTLFHECRRNLNNAVKEGGMMIKHLEAAFNPTIDRLCSGANNRYDVVKSKANEMFQILALATDRNDKNPGTARAIIDTIRQMEGTGEIDFERLFTYYKV